MKTIDIKVGDKVRIIKKGRFYNLNGKILSIATDIYPLISRRLLPSGRSSSTLSFCS